MHLDEDRLESLRHRELDEAALRAAQEHLAGCAACRDRVAEAEREERTFAARLGALDSPAPPVRVGDLVARAHAGAVRRRRWAAAAVLAALVGLAAAAPGSPLRVWVASVVKEIFGRSPGERARDAEPDSSGIAVAPGRSLVIDIALRQASGMAHVLVVDGEEVVLRAGGGAVTFQSSAETLRVRNPGHAADLTIRIPRSAPRVELRLDGQTVLLKEGDRMRTGAPPDPNGGYLVPLR